jgi:dipeptidyl aminopeptidase/acylaminoacyl peptidase
MAHGTTGTMNFGLARYAQRFAAAGFAVLVFDYRHFGASDGWPRQLIRVGRQVADWRAAVRFARMLPQVDPDRVRCGAPRLVAGTW